MKKIYLLSVALLTAASMFGADKVSNANLSHFSGAITNSQPKAKIQKAPAKAGAYGIMDFSYCDEPYNAIPLHEGNLGMAIGMTAEDATLFAGNQITFIQVANPVNMQASNQATYDFVNTLTTCTVQIYEDLNSDPVYSCPGTLGTQGFEWSNVKLETPYDIEAGKAIYIAVMYDNVTSQDCALIVDGVRATNKNSSWVYSRFKSVGSGGAPILQDDYSWKDFGTIAGSVCLRAVIGGYNLPTDRAYISNFNVPLAVSPNADFVFDFMFQNLGSNDITSVDVVLEVDGMEPQTYTSVAESGNVGYKDYDYSTAYFKVDHEGIAIPYTAYISKINGEAVNNLADNKVSGTILCIEEGFQRVVMAEEFTSTYCPWCPIGYVGMEYMRQQFGLNGWWAGMAVHANFNGKTDPMQVCSAGKCYYDFAQSTSGYLPMSYLFRDFSLDVQPNMSTLMSIFNAYHLTPAPVSVAAKLEGSGTDVTLTVDNVFSLDVENADLGISYTITEDDLGPYLQYNDCSGGSDPEYGDFAKLPSQTYVKFNDVVREGSVYNPIANSLPTTIEKGETYTYTTKLDLSAIKNIENYAVTAIVIDRTTGRALNCHRVYSPDKSGIEQIDAEQGKPVAIGQEGAIMLFGNGDIYGVNGQLIAKNAKGNVTVPAGIYLVRNDKGAVKVIVR